CCRRSGRHRLHEHPERHRRPLQRAVDVQRQRGGHVDQPPYVIRDGRHGRAV
ncbi:hypothetical protein BDFB_005876, partial [Asbolus verrucosus]